MGPGHFNCPMGHLRFGIGISHSSPHLMDKTTQSWFVCFLTRTKLSLVTRPLLFLWPKYLFNKFPVAGEARSNFTVTREPTHWSVAVAPVIVHQHPQSSGLVDRTNGTTALSWQNWQRHCKHLVQNPCH